MLIKIHILTNFCKKNILIKNVNVKEIISDIRENILREVNNFDIKSLCFSDGLIFDENLLSKYIDNQCIELFYTKIIAPNCAKEFDRINGIIFYFHTNENNHREYPHVHVNYSGEQVSINLKNFKINGCFKNKNKEMFVLNYVKRNKTVLLNEWEKIIKGS